MDTVTGTSDADESLIRQLIAEQFPEWVGLPVTPVRPGGTDNTLFRLGRGMVVRLPRVAGAGEDVGKEYRWLPRLSGRLPLPVPVPLAVGEPGAGFPYPWSVHRWMTGRDAVREPVADPLDAATRLGGFVAAMRGFDGAGGPPSFRGGPLGALDGAVRAAIDDLNAQGLVDPDAATAVWQRALAARPWEGPPVWTHSDLHPANLLVRKGRLAGVIDFGGLGVGDPACDMLPAWTLLTAATRDAFRAASGADDATWARGRGWGLCFGLGGVRIHRHTNPVLGAIGRHALTEALAG